MILPCCGSSEWPGDVSWGSRSDKEEKLMIIDKAYQKTLDAIQAMREIGIIIKGRVNGGKNVTMSE